MPFAFSEVCSFLEYLEALETVQPPLLAADKQDRLRCTTEAWFKSHRNTIDKLDIDGAVALLSCLLFERRSDRVYGLQSTSLCRILSRSLGLGTAQNKYLLAYKQPGRGDLAACVQRVLEKGGPPALPRVNLHEIDELLTWLASQCRFSDPVLHGQPSASSEVRDRRLGGIFKRLDGRDAKWLIRLILKDLSPSAVDAHLVLKCFHFLMPDLLQFQQDFRVAVTSLKTLFQLYPSNPDQRSERLLKLNASSSLAPLINVKVSRPAFTKARSIEHCLQMLGNYSWVIERKYDGEYAEIHIDLSRSVIPQECIKIYSKNGKDATQDRAGIHETLVKCLRLGQTGCKIRQKAILLGELVAWSDKTSAVLPFEEIRKHVTRSGFSLGTAKDSRAQDHEHLCIVFFDVLLLDDNVTMALSVEKRRQILTTVYDKIRGRAKGAEWKVVEFGQGEISQRRLMEQFAASNAQGCEGLVLKPCGLPYYALERDPSRSFHGYIKLKKDYISGLGDEADLAVIGASYNAQEAAKSRLLNLRWTEFHLGAMLNKDEVIRYGRRPLMRIVGTISQHHCIPPTILEAVNQLATFHVVDPSAASTLDYDIEPGNASKLTNVFKTPLVFEVLGSGFVKPSDSDCYMLRHARVTKLHQDRSWTECTGFDELQHLAEASRDVGVASESQENRKHLAHLEKTMKKRLQRRGTLSPASKKTTTTSPSTQGGAAQGGSSIDRTPTIAGPRKPLADMSNNLRASAPESSVRDLDGTTAVVSSPTPVKKRVLDTTLTTTRSKRVCLQQESTAKRIVRAPTAPTTSRRPPRSSPLAANQAAVRAQRWKCAKTNCIFANTVVYLTPCIATTPYISFDLLAAHEVATTTRWQDWSRETSENAESSSTVAESQAYEGLRRVVLVEAKRKAAYGRAIDCLLTSTHAVDVEVWDWRVLEYIQDHEASMAAAVRHMVGIITRCEVTGSVIFEALEGRG